MNKNDLINALTRRHPGRTKTDTAAFLTDLIDIIVRENAADERVVITGFGTFEPVKRSHRIGRNPHTGEEVPIPVRIAPKFRPSPAYRAYVADPSSLPERTVGQRSPVKGAPTV